jgi:hypothetical protein
VFLSLGSSATKHTPTGYIPYFKTINEYLEKVASHFTGSSKAYACSLMMEPLTKSLPLSVFRQHKADMS